MKRSAWKQFEVILRAWQIDGYRHELKILLPARSDFEAHRKAHERYELQMPCEILSIRKVDCEPQSP